MIYQDIFDESKLVLGIYLLATTMKITIHAAKNANRNTSSKLERKNQNERQEMEKYRNPKITKGTKKEEERKHKR